MKEVLLWLPLSAVRTCADDGENVHRLRVSTRRASVALKAFEDLVDPDEAHDLRMILRDIRKAADAARNVDATAECFLARSNHASDELRAKLRERLAKTRDEAQSAIVAVQQKIAENEFADRVRSLLSDIETRYPKRAQKKFGKRACKILKPALKRFLKASKSDVTTDAGLHLVRIQAKKLRYSMELVSVVFEPAFSGALYDQFCEFQDVMGQIRDRVTMQEILNTWLAEPCDESERAFLESLVVLEKAEHAEWLKKFQAFWTPEYVRNLKQEFEAHMTATC